MISSSMKLSFTGLQVDWMTNTSQPRTVSLMDTAISPSANFLQTQSPSGIPSLSAMALARAGLELPAKSLILFPCVIMLVYPLCMFIQYKINRECVCCKNARCAGGQSLPDSRRFLTQPGLTVWRDRATTRLSSGTSSVMVPPAAR